MDELITIIIDDKYKESLNITVNRFPDKIVKFGYMSSLKQNKINTLKNFFLLNKIDYMILFNRMYENDINDLSEIVEYYEMLVRVDNIDKSVLVKLRGYDTSTDHIKEEYILSQEESNELINKLLDIGEIINRGEI